jgi:hypothetical protein
MKLAWLLSILIIPYTNAAVTHTILTFADKSSCERTGDRIAKSVPPYQNGKPSILWVCTQVKLP